MELDTITEDPHVARRAFLDYRNTLREPLRERATAAERELRDLDEEIMRGYREMAAGVTLLRLSETIRAGGFEHRDIGNSCFTDLPRLAIARATARKVWCPGIERDGDVGFSWATTEWRQQLSWSRRNSVKLDETFEPHEGEWRDRTSRTFHALVPTVPPKYRPTRGLEGYHVLFEATWATEPAPSDPALLRHIGGDLWAVLATWDLTPLEAAVLGQRS